MALMMDESQRRVSSGPAARVPVISTGGQAERDATIGFRYIVPRRIWCPDDMTIPGAFRGPMAYLVRIVGPARPTQGRLDAQPRLKYDVAVAPCLVGRDHWLSRPTVAAPRAAAETSMSLGSR